jgi:hypothetical protein
VLDVVTKGVAQGSRMLLGQVDLVGQAVQPELDGLIGWALVEVIEEGDHSLLILLGVGAALLQGSVTTRATVAVSLSWFLLIGGVADTTTLPARDGDARIMAGKHPYPWLGLEGLLGFVAVVALIVGASCSCGRGTRSANARR